MHRTQAALLVWCLLAGAAVVGTTTALHGAAAAESRAGTFVDDDGNVHEPMIEAIVAAGITHGCNAANPTLYCPGLELSRAAMASFLYRTFKLPQSNTDAFDDDEGSIHETAINAIAAVGIAEGTGNRTFSPDAKVSRAQMATFLARGLQLPLTAPPQFVDVSGVHAASINAIAQAGIAVGCDLTGPRFCPHTNVRRDQMASFLGRSLPLLQLNYSLPPQHGSIALQSGFVPDPATVGVTGGGPVKVSYLGGGCAGHTTRAPDFSVNFTKGPFPMLRFYFIAARDSTMVINGPNGTYRCSDDSYSTLNPTIDYMSPQSGRYDIWIGTYTYGGTVSGTLYVTENSASHP